MLTTFFLEICRLQINRSFFYFTNSHTSTMYSEVSPATYAQYSMYLANGYWPARQIFVVITTSFLTVLKCVLTITR